MDLQKLAGTLLSGDALAGIGKASGASASDVGSVLQNALPALLQGAKGQADNKDTTEGFVGALAQHAKNDSSDLTSFLGNIDLEDGGKIIGHLLGGEQKATTKKVAKASGVSQKKTGNILSAAAPLLMNLLGQQAEEDEEKESGISGLMGSLLGNVDMSSLLGGLLASSLGSSGNSSKPSGLGGLLGGLFGGSSKPSSSSSQGGGLLGGLLGGLFKKK